MKQRIPLGVSEFQEIRKKSYYYVDKTSFIEEILNDGSKVILFTRPRRFGKTLNMTMLREFFDITKENSMLFKGLYIENSDCFSQINSYPTLFFSFRDCKGNRSEVILGIKLTIIREYLKYRWIEEELSGYEREKFNRIFHALKDEEATELIYIRQSISFLMEVLQNYYHKPIVLLIDEYDTPMVEAYIGEYYEDLRGFFTNLFGSALKDNPNLEKGIITGIQRIAKENIFSGLNNLLVCSVTDRHYNSYFGLTSEETKKILDYYELRFTKEVSSMYNGYCFAGVQIYNPWSILNYVYTKELVPAWVNTSSNKLIRKLIRESNTDFKQDFEALVADKTVSVAIDFVTSFWELREAKTLWGLLLNAGYITLKESNTRAIRAIVIPNKEVNSEF